MANLDPRIEAIRVKYDLSGDAFWQLPQKKGCYLIKHADLEVVAVKAEIRFDMPVIIEAKSGDGVAAVCVQGQMGDRFEWSIGECSPKNNKNAYPWAMAEKRAKDRVVLKLIGIHGLVYSEDEMSDAEPAPRVLVKDQREIDIELRAEIQACATEAELVTLWKTPLFQTELKKLKQDWQDAIVDLFRETKADRLASPAQIPRGYVEPVFPPQ